MSEDRIGTHFVGCWESGPRHYECAVKMLTEVTAERDALKAEVKQLRENITMIERIARRWNNP